MVLGTSYSVERSPFVFINSILAQEVLVKAFFLLSEKSSRLYATMQQPGTPIMFAVLDGENYASII